MYLFVKTDSTLRHQYQWQWRLGNPVHRFKSLHSLLVILEKKKTMCRTVEKGEKKKASLRSTCRAYTINMLRKTGFQIETLSNLLSGTKDFLLQWIIVIICVDGMLLGWKKNKWNKRDRVFLSGQLFLYTKSTKI